MPDIPPIVPSRVVAGDTIKFKLSLGDYPATVWSLTVELRGADGAITWTGVASGADHLVEVSAATSAAYTAGRYHWHAYVTASAERYHVDRGTIEIQPNFAAAGAADRRTHAETALDAINAVLESRASKDQESYSIAGRTLQRTPIADLIRLQSHYRAEVERERRAERMRRGLGGPSRVVVRLP